MGICFCLMPHFKYKYKTRETDMDTVILMAELEKYFKNASERDREIFNLLHNGYTENEIMRMDFSRNNIINAKRRLRFHLQHLGYR